MRKTGGKHETRAKGAPGLPMAPQYMTKADAERAMRREGRAMASAAKHGRDSTDIASHIARNSSIACGQKFKEAANG